MRQVGILPLPHTIHQHPCMSSFVTCKATFYIRSSFTNTSTSDCIYHFCEGHDATQHAAFGEAAHIAVTLRMHEEASYDGLDPIECEVRRRIFWLLFGGKFLQLNCSALIRWVYSQPINQCRFYLVAQFVYETKIVRFTSRKSWMTNSASHLLG